MNLAHQQARARVRDQVRQRLNIGEKCKRQAMARWVRQYTHGMQPCETRSPASTSA